MGQLFENIKQAVRQERYVVSDHADERLRERKIELWQVVGGVEDGKLLMERPNETPLPVVEVEQLLADGTSVKVVWGWWQADNVAKLITVHLQ